tara:strand:- start:29476 stop:29712 length:237 start_codon:yes stop_codon:yes gene_type:complete
MTVGCTADGDNASREKWVRSGSPGLGDGISSRVLAGVAVGWRVSQASARGRAIGRSRRSPDQYEERKALLDRDAAGKS